ncbi:MAG: AEC family transporter [Rectinema subterraneum]|uniref:AEC family transporter n=1 Tax=Rectinema subterraneum TaxID=2653714 RepID=UPI003C7C8937
MTLSRVVSIFLLLIVGFIAQKRKILDSDGIKTISNFVLRVFLPFTIISSFDKSISLSAAGDLLKVAIFAIGVHALAIFISKLAYSRFPDPKRKILTYITVFSNCGFMGFPVAESVFGKIGLMYTSIYVMVFNIFVWTYGIALLSEGKEKKNIWHSILLNPGNIAFAIGFVLWVLPFGLPETLNYTVLLLGNCTTPLSMIVVGATLANLGIKGLFLGTEVWIGSIMRLFVVPALVLLLFILIGIRSDAAKVANFLAAMPAAAQTVIFAERYDADVSLASRIVFISTVLSAITIPLASGIIAG